MTACRPPSTKQGHGSHFYRWPRSTPQPTSVPPHPKNGPATFGSCIDSSRPQGGCWVTGSLLWLAGKSFKAVPKVLDFPWCLWICIGHGLSNLVVQIRQLVLALRRFSFLCVFFFFQLLFLSLPFPWTRPVWERWICSVILLIHFQYLIWFWCFHHGHSSPFIIFVLRKSLECYHRQGIILWLWISALVTYK